MITFIIAAAILIPLIWVFVQHQEFTILEFLLSILAGLFITFICNVVSTTINSWDTQILNGRVVSKERKQVSCSHSYSCHCKIIRTKNGSTRSCSTCYEHSFDVDWVVHSDIGNEEISRVDRRGLLEPPRFSQVAIGEPFSKWVSYDNPIKGNPYSLYNKSSLKMVEAWKAKLPDYPEIDDYYRINRVLTSGVNLPDLKAWQDDLSNVNRDLNPSKKVNINLIFTKEKSLDFAAALDAKWIGGKKNDVVAIVSVDDDLGINWVKILSYSADSSLKVYLRDHLTQIGKVDREKFMSIIKQDVGLYYKHESFKKFDYLRFSSDMGDTAFYVSLLVTCLSSLAICWFFSRPGMDLRLTKRGW